MIVITTPTGAVGRQVLTNVLDCGEPIRVIARDPSRLTADVRERVDVVCGSHSDIDVVSEAFEGADSVFWLVPLNARADSVEAAVLDFTRPACAALADSSVRRVVGISALGRGLATNAGLVTASLAMDDLIASTGTHYRALAMPAFMENLLRQVDAIRRQGMFFSPISPDRKLPTVATRDIATVAAGLLRDHSWTGVDTIPLLGPEDLSFNDIAEIISDVLGRRVRFQRVPAHSYQAAMTRMGMSEAMARGVVDMLMAKNEGLDDVRSDTPRSATPTGFRSWCEEVLRPAVLA